MKMFKFFMLSALLCVGTIIGASCGDDDEEDDQKPNNGAKDGFASLPGVFSVSTDKKVAFSSGNLQYQASTKTWRFAPNQTDTIGVANEMISESYDGWIDLFGWGTGDNPTKSSESYSDYPTFNDWGKNIGDDSTWFTLSIIEWGYLLTKREDASKKKGVAAVNGINGVVLLPDEFVLPDGLNFNNGRGDSNDKDSFKSVNEYNTEQWTKMEAAGAVFLPAAGHRNCTSDVYRDSGFYSNSGYGFYGYYWSRTPYAGEKRTTGRCAYCVCVLAYCIDTLYGGDRDEGMSVRLVRVVE